MITREDLENAALAVGMKSIRMSDDGSGLCAYGLQDVWRPHTDHGHAGRLAEMLLMYVDSRGTAVQARVVGAEWHRVARDGNTSAWREAVVLCAADAGKRMKGGA